LSATTIADIRNPPLPHLLQRLLPDTFLLILVATLAAATLLPARGDYATVVHWLANLTVVLLFFFHGAKLARSAVVAGLTHWRLHLLILGSTFGMFPLLGWALASLLPGLLSPVLWTGVLFLVALPSTVQSSIAFVSIAKGNVPGAIAAASASQVLGVFLTPLLVGLLAGTDSDGSDAVAGVGQVALLILLPFTAGHLLRPWIGEFVARHKSTIAITDRATIVLAVYSAFSAAVIDGIWNQLPPAQFANLFIVCALLMAFALGFTTLLARLGSFSREDEIVLVFCGTKKSLVQGAPMARVLFAGPEAGLILLPIMIFHQLQLMVCAWIAKHYAAGAPAHE
jgi:sodium/bile acid cotransporter 7